VRGEAVEPRLVELLAPVRLVALDVDGTLTDGSIVAAPDEDHVRFSIVDGLGIKLLQRAGIVVAWISGRGPRSVERRARELGVTEVATRTLDKAPVLAEMQTRLGIAPRETAAMGDDLPDLSMRSRVAFFAAPASARAEVASRADLVTVARGGEGAVRELAELILRAQGRWSAIVGEFAGER
jgi:3-deoxy-D-manno-octulosonate 8-phosphate phosphatase (KDO 8-P phosphatase)